MYRAQSDADYALENVNAADLVGVLMYLHKEVVTTCPRKYGITRIRRFKVSVMPTRELFERERRHWGPFVAFDFGKCTVPNCDELWEKYGYVVGSQEVFYGNISGRWFSLPGPCPSQDVKSKTGTCVRTAPGGSNCAKKNDDDNAHGKTSALRNLASHINTRLVVSGLRDCTYRAEEAGEVSIDELSGIKNYTSFCAENSLEFDKDADRGVNSRFWDGFHQTSMCRHRIHVLNEAFRKKYPHLPPDSSENQPGWVASGAAGILVR